MANFSNSTFGRELMTYLASRLPYAGLNKDITTAELNPKYKYFEGIGSHRAEALARHSITQSNEYNSMQSSEIHGDNRYNQVMYANIQKDKGARIRDYRIIAAFAEVSDALDEICDEAINKNEKGSCTKLVFRNTKISDYQKGVLEEEFDRYIQYFNLEHKGWEYIRQLLVEGELFFEHIIHKDYSDQGILGIVQIPCDLIDPVYSNIQNVMTKGYLYRKPIYDPNNPTKQIKVEFIPMDKNQVTYINSGIWNENRTMRLPFIENCRRAYRQLSMIEDSIVIYRLVRAPEKLVFNVDTGNMPAPKAEAYIKKLVAQYWNSKTFDLNENSIVQKMNPQSMLDSFWFARRAGSEGTQVTQLAGGCLAMDTKVPLLDGRVITLQEATDEYNAGKTNWVYSCNPDTGHIVPGLITWAGVTQESAKVLKITLDNGKELTCTLDHKFPVIGKGFVEAKDLIIGESMIPFNTDQKPLGKRKYTRVYQPDTKKWEFVHRTTAEFLKGTDMENEMLFSEKYADKPKTVIHHKDFNRFNNNPENLTWMVAADHIKYHASKRFEPMVGTIAARKRILDMKVNHPEQYKEHCRKIGERSAKVWENYTPEEYDAKRKQLSKSITAYIHNLSPEDRQERRERSIKHLATGHEKKKELLKDPVYKQNIYKKTSATLKAKYQLSEYKELASRRSYNNWKNPAYRAKQKQRQTIIFDKRILDFVAEFVVNKTTHELTKHEVLVELNTREDLKELFITQNNHVIVANRGRITEFVLSDLKSMTKSFGYKNWMQFRQEAQFHNHKIVNIEYLDDPIQVGTLTIDGDEKYHNYHTFALDCGIFTKNSQLGQLEDLHYFVKKLYKALKVPTTRLDPEDAFRDGQDMLREELKFARFIIRLQEHIASGLTNGFVTHLQLRGLWDEYEVKEQDLCIEFNIPTNFYELRENQRLELKLNNFNNMLANPTIAPTFAQKKILGWSDVEVLANREFLRKDKEFLWELMQIEANGPNWKQMLETQSAAAGEEMGMDMGGAMGAGGVPPSFGGSASIGTDIPDGDVPADVEPAPVEAPPNE